jgi:membrane fusion protein, multidrug efflux system
MPSALDLEIQRKRRRFWLIFLGSVCVCIALVCLVYWLLIGRFYVYTEDAYTHGNAVMLTPQVAAGVKAIYADETDFVEQGQLVVVLDSTDFELQCEALKQGLADTVRKVSALFQDLEAKQAQIVLKQAQLKQAQLDVDHRTSLVKTGAVSVEEYEIYQTTMVVAESALTFAEKEYAALKALVAGTSIATHPMVQQASWNVKQVYLSLIRCQIWAPVTGFIAKRSVQVGDQVAIGSTLLYIVALDQIWVDANYKETALKNVRLGQKVTFTADLYGREVIFHGIVLGFQPGSGNAFALLPPENASGNWIKIIQRVPIRIRIDPQELIAHPLLLGLSMRVKIAIHDTSGPMLAHVPTCGPPLYTTPLYCQQMDEMSPFDLLISTLIAENSK